MFASIIWGAVGMLVGVLVASQLNFFQLNFNTSYLTFGHLRPHGSLGYISPIEFEQKLEAESSTQGKGSSRPSASFPPSLDLIYTFNHCINPSRLTV